jgi:DNA replication factor GINS
MDDEEFSYKTLRKIQQSEKQSPKVTKIPKSFYDDVKTYLDGLQNQLEKETKHKRQMLLADEIQNMEKIITNIYEQREKKIIMAAMSRVRSGNPHLHDLLDPELKLFDDLQQVLKGARKRILSNENEPEPLLPLTDSGPEIQDREETEEAIDEEPVIEEEHKIVNDHEMIRIVKDMPTFVGTDAKQYTVKVGDVLSVPAQMADMLVKRRIAERIDMST